MTTPAPTPSPDGGFDDHAGAALAALVRRFASADGDGDDARPAFDAGMVARLRRLPAGGAASVDVWTALHGALPPERVDALVPERWEAAARRAGRAWGLVLHGLALMAPDPHQPGRPPGEALAAAGFSEARLTQLLRAEDQAFADHFASACRFLRSKGERPDWTRFGRLVLERLDAPGIPEGQRDRTAEAIARAYVRAVHHAARPAPAEA